VKGDVNESQRDGTFSHLQETSQGMVEDFGYQKGIGAS